jgi:hypothetical protein
MKKLNSGCTQIANNSVRVGSDSGWIREGEWR